MDLLSSHLGIVVASIGNRNATKSFSNAYFLGDHKVCKMCKILFLQHILKTLRLCSFKISFIVNELWGNLIDF